MSTGGVTSGSNHGATAGASAASKANPANGERAGKSGSAQAPKGDIFAMLLMMMNSGNDIPAEAAMEPGATVPEEQDVLPIGQAADAVDQAAWGPLDLKPATADPVQAMLASRYPIERSPSKAGTDGGMPQLAGATGPTSGGIDVSTLGMQATDDPGPLSPATGEAPAATTQTDPPPPAGAARPLAPATSSRVDVQGLKMLRAPSASAASTGIQAARATAEQAAQVAVTYANRTGDAPARSGFMAVRSTVTLDARTASLEAGPGANPVTSLDGAGSPLSAQPSNSSGGTAEHGQHGGFDGAVAPQIEAPDDESADGAGFADAQASDEATAEPWGTGSLQQARMTIAGDGGETIDVQLQLAGESVNVEFRTDDEHAREQLFREAGRDLAERLEQEGLSLIDVSVGGRQDPGTRQRPGGSPSPAEVGRTAGTGQRVGGAPADVLPDAGLRPRTDPGRPLDMFV